MEYDATGNKILESRWFDGLTPRDDMVFEYDGAGRLIERRETLGRVTRYEYDAVGNLVSERLTSNIVDDGFVPRLTETVYDELNRPIEVRRQLGEGFVITRTKYDGEGNRLQHGEELLHVGVGGVDLVDDQLRPSPPPSTQDADCRRRQTALGGPAWAAMSAISGGSVPTGPVPFTTSLP
jgi:YD repeat-containing protein